MGGGDGQGSDDRQGSDVVSEGELAARVGHRFPGGLARVEPWVDWLMRDVVGSPPAEGGLAHPLAAFLLAKEGLGIGLEDLFALFGASALDGPMLGEWSADILEPLRIGRDYRVSGEVVSAVRKHGARTGVFDLVTVAVTLAGDDGRVHAVVRPAYVFPRRPS